MAGAREHILGQLRRSLGRSELSPEARAELERRLRAHEPNLVPRRGQGSHGEQVAGFVRMAEAADATIARVEGLDQVPGSVADYLARHNLSTELVAAPDPRLDDIPWGTRPMLKLRRGRAEEKDQVSLTAALAGVAETGTLVLASGPDSPTTLGFMPMTHIVVLREGEIVGAFEETWERLRKRSGSGKHCAMPRTVNMITGPSRSGDIEQRLLLGAHGPKRLHIVVVADAQRGPE